MKVGYRLMAVAILASLVSLAASRAVAEVPGPNRKPTLTEDKRFWIFRNTFLNAWLPVGWMPGNAADMITLFGPNSPDGPKKGSQAIHVRVGKWRDPCWCGVSFSIPDPGKKGIAYWGDTPALGWDLRGAKRVVFWARSPNGARVQFKAGIVGDKPFGDSLSTPAQTAYLGLTPQWKEYSIDLSDKDLSRVVTAFCFVLNRQDQVDPEKSQDFYLADIYWDFGDVTSQPTTIDPEAARFWIYHDQNLNDWAPANWMPAEAASMMTQDAACADHPQEGRSCMHFRVDKWISPYWCGVAWAVQDPKNPGSPYWGEAPATAWDLRGARKIVFWARSPQGARIQFKLGILGDKPYGDSLQFPAQTEFITLTPGWKEYSINLSGLDLARVVTGFCFVTNRDQQQDPEKPMDLFLDTIYVEGGNPTRTAAK